MKDFTFGLGHLLIVTEHKGYEHPTYKKSWFLGVLTPSCPVCFSQAGNKLSRGGTDNRIIGPKLIEPKIVEPKLVEARIIGPKLIEGKDSTDSTTLLTASSAVCLPQAGDTHIRYLFLMREVPLQLPITADVCQLPSDDPTLVVQANTRWVPRGDR